MSNEESNLFEQELEKLLDQHDYELPEVGDIRKGVVVSVSQRGVIIDLGLKRDGLVPSSDLEKLSQEERDAIEVNDEIPVYITNTDKPESLLVSIHLAQLNQDWIDAEKFLESGEIIEGEVIGYNKGGAIVPYGRLRGFIPASHLVDLTPGMSDRKRQQRLAKLRTQKIPVKVIEVDRRRRRLVFSQRDAQKEWEEKRKEELLANLKEGDTLTGTVSGLRDFGVFVNLGGADGLVHISELAWHRVTHPKEVLKVGDEIEVYVLKLDQDGQRISLSRKRLLQNPWDTVTERYSENQLVEGTITRIVDYGAFAEIEPGVEGLLHVSQLSRGNVRHASEVVQEGETHLLRIVSIDERKQRIGLSLKAVKTHEQIEWMAQRQLDDEASVEQASEEVEVSDEQASEEVEVSEEQTSQEEAVAETAVEEATAEESETVAESTSEEESETVAESTSEEEESETVLEKVADAVEDAVETVTEKVQEIAEAVSEKLEEITESDDADETSDADEASDDDEEKEEGSSSD